MAINYWITGTVDPSAATKTDRINNMHLLNRGTAAAGDFTLSFDTAKVITLSSLKSLLDQAFKVVQGGTELTS